MPQQVAPMRGVFAIDLYIRQVLTGPAFSNDLECPFYEPKRNEKTTISGFVETRDSSLGKLGLSRPELAVLVNVIIQFGSK